MTAHRQAPQTEVAHIRCPWCGTVFSSPLQVDRATLEALLPEVTGTCPSCGRSAVYRKHDHWYELVLDGDPGP